MIGPRRCGPITIIDPNTEVISVMPTVNFLTRKARADKAAVNRAKNLLQSVYGFGSTGYSLIEIAASVEPALKDSLLAIDGEIPKDKAQDDHVVVVGEGALRRFLDRRHAVQLLAEDPWLASIVFPTDAHRAAGGAKAIGWLKSAFKLDAWTEKAGLVLDGQLRGVEREEPLVVNLHFISSACGGMGAAIIIPAALRVRALVRRKAPGATCQIILHLLNVSLYESQVTDPDEKNKLWANDFCTALEICFAQDPAHVYTMARLLGLGVPEYPTFDRVIPYHKTDEAGRSYTLEETLRERVLANILSQADEALVGKLRERGANTVTMLAGLDRGVARRIVTTCQAQTARIPGELGPYWAAMRTRAELAQRLGEPAEERVTELTALLKTGLRIEESRSAVNGAFDEVKTQALVLPRSVKRHRPTQARSYLKEIFDRFASAVKEELDAKQGQVLEHYASVAVPEVVAGLRKTLAAKVRSVCEVAATFGRLQQRVSDLGQRAGQEAEKAAEIVRTKRNEFAALQGKLTTQTLAGGLKARAAEALNKMIDAELTRRCHRTFQQVAEVYQAALSDAEQEAESVRHALAQELGPLEADCRRLGALATKQSGLSVSVIQPEELKDVVAIVDRAVAGMGTLPRLDLVTMLEDGPHAIGRHVDSHVTVLDGRFDRYFETQVGDVGGAVKTFRLKFSVEKFVERAVRTLSCSSPVEEADGASAEPRTILIAHGRDLEASKGVLARRPILKQLEVAEGFDSKAITVHRRVEGLTVRSLPTFEDGKRAALRYPKPGTPGVSAWEALPPCGHLLGAYQQVGLVPDEWLTPAPQPQTQRRSVKPVNTNTNGDSL
jgi:hypothetical protein